MGNTFARLPKLEIHRRQMMFGTGVGATAAALGSVIPNIALAQPAAGSALKYSDGIAASRTMIAIAGNAAGLQRRLPSGWELAPFAGTDLQGTMLTGANMLVPFHEVYAIKDQGRTSGLPQASYVPFLSQARNQATRRLAYFHWLLYTEDPDGVPGKYHDAKLARITRSQTFTKEQRGVTLVNETFSAVADSGEINLSLTYQQGGALIWVSANAPNLQLYSAQDPRIERWYKEDQVIDVVRSDPRGINRVSDISIKATGELADVFDGKERIVAVVIQRPYFREVYVP